MLQAVAQRDRGLLQRYPGSELPLTIPGRPPPTKRLHQPPSQHRTRSFTVLGHHFAFEVPDRSWAAYLDRTLGSLAADAPVSPSWSVVDQGTAAEGGRFAAYRGGQRLFGCHEADDVVPLLLWWVNRTVCFETDHRVMVHAAVAARDGRAVVLPAPQGSGKTTLVTALVQEGLGYLTDEAAAFDPVTGSVDPYPKWLSLKPGSWALFPGLRPQLPPGLARFAVSQWHVDPEEVRPGAVAVRADPAWIVVPSYRPGAPTALEPMERSEALSVLAGEAFNLRRLGREGFDALAGTVRRGTCWRLTTGALGDAVAAVRSLTG